MVGNSVFFHSPHNFGSPQFPHQEPQEIETMPSFKRIKTNYPGVFYIEGTSPATGKPEKIYYIRYRKDGKMIEEKAGRQFQDDMTPARASRIRAERIEGKSISRKEARDAAAEFKWTVDRLWEQYSSHKVLSKSLRVDQGRYKNYLQPAMGGKEPRTIVHLDIDRLRLTLLKTRKPMTVKHVLELLQRIANFGAKKGLCPGLGFKIEMPRVDNLRTEDLNPEQLSKLLAAIDQDHDTQAANFMKLVLFTGMRRGELFKLKWQDIDFERGFINIRTPKGGKDQNIPLNPPARELLEDHPRDGNSPFVFPGRKGKQRKDIRRPINRIRKRADLPPDFRPLHGLRHTYASMLASSGLVDLFTLQKLLTHKTTAMTMRYAHLRDEALRNAANLAGNLIEQLANGAADLQKEGES
jgi:integrase